MPALFNGRGCGPPPPLTAASTWTWIGHPVSGLRLQTIRTFHTWFPYGSAPAALSLACNRNSPDRSTKSTRLGLNALPQLVGTGFQVLFHSPPGVLFTFPSRYYSLSVTEEYLALRGGPRSFIRDSTCPALLWILLPSVRLRIRDYHSLWCAFPSVFFCLSSWRLQSEPRSARTSVWALPRSIASTYGITVVFSSSGYLDVSVHRVPPVHLCIQCTVTGSLLPGFPIQTSPGIMPICGSPGLFAAYHVFHRLSVPGHPPCALSCLTNPIYKIYIWFSDIPY